MYFEDISVEELLELYRKGERHFSELSVEGNLQGVNLEGIRFERCFMAVHFRNANLKNTQFINENIKTSDFREANLTNAHFEGLAVECTFYKGAITEGLIFKDNSDMSEFHSRAKGF